MSSALSPLLSNPVSSPRPPEAGRSRQEIAGVAQQFEALMLNQLLQSASSSSGEGSWLGVGEEDQAGMQAMQLAQEQFAQALAAGGGLGLAQLAVSGLADEPRQIPPVSPPAAAAAQPVASAGMDQ